MAESAIYSFIYLWGGGGGGGGGVKVNFHAFAVIMKVIVWSDG